MLTKAAILYARIALAAAFLSAVASRFGVWDGTFQWHAHFSEFIDYTAQVNSFAPRFAIPFLAWAATVAETVLAVALLIGKRLRLVAVCAAVLLALFGSAMAASLGPKSPLDYSVFSASAAACLLAAPREEISLCEEQ